MYNYTKKVSKLIHNWMNNVVENETIIYVALNTGVDIEIYYIR